MNDRYSIYHCYLTLSIFLASLCHSTSCFASASKDAISLSESLSLAHKSSPELRKAELKTDAVGWDRLEAISEHLPHLTLRGTHFFGAKYAVLGVLFEGNSVQFPSAFPQSDVQLEASILLFDGLSSINRYRAARYESDAAELELSHLKFKVDERVKVKFYQTLAAQELAKVADQNIEALEQHLKLAQVSEHVGVSTKVDVLRIESQLEEAQADKILTSDQIEISKQELLEVLGIEKDERPLDGTLPTLESMSLPANLALDVSQREDVQALSKRESAQDRLSASANAFWSPKIYLFGTEQFYKYGNFDPKVLPNDSFQNAYAFGLRVTWNLFDGGAYLAKKGRADDTSKIAAENYRQAMISSPHEFEVWKRKFIYNKALYLARKRAVEKSSESVRLASLGVRAGTKTHSETLDAELELFRARAGVIRAQMDALEAWANLELALGHRI
jgi:outer membrane protein TolC